jgi:hypothetical protein
VACYNWDDRVCPGEDFASQNMNYELTSSFSYYTEYICADDPIAREPATFDIFSNDQKCELHVLGQCFINDCLD